MVVSPLAEMLAAPLPQAVVYVACLRNLEVTARTIARRHSRVAVLGAGERGEVCTEDQMVASWLAERLHRRGFELEGRNTALEVERWGSPDVTLVGWSRSAERLRAGGRARDVEFVLEHVDDLDVVCVGGELCDPVVTQRSETSQPRRATGGLAQLARAAAGSRRLAARGDRRGYLQRRPKTVLGA